MSITECNEAITKEHISYNISTLTCGYDHICKITNSSSTCSILMSIFPGGKLTIAEIEDGFWVIITYAVLAMIIMNLFIHSSIMWIGLIFLSRQSFSSWLLILLKKSMGSWCILTMYIDMDYGRHYWVSFYISILEASPSCSPTQRILI